MVRCVRGYSMRDSHRGGRMQKLGAVAATGMVLALGLAAWTRQPVPPAQGGGTISGKVKFTGAKPAMPKIDMSEEPKCKAKYTAAPPTEEAVVVNANGILHNIKAKGTKNRPFNISQPAVMTSDRTFTAPEVMVPLECNVHGWMHAWLGVLPHPFFGVSGSDGSFTIKGLPPGTYTIEAWHEKYGTQTATVTVAGSETKTADFSFAAK